VCCAGRGSGAAAADVGLNVMLQLSMFLTESVFHIPRGAQYLPRYATDEEGTLEGRWLAACEAEAPERRAALRTVLASAPEGPLKAHLRANAGQPDGAWARDLLAMIG
jgi:phytoene/squalene synthetase